MAKSNSDSEKIKKKPFSRSSYTPEMGQEICRIVATHPEGQKKLCIKFPHLPNHDTINEWRWQFQDFSDQYAKAKMQQSELMAEQISELSEVANKYIDSEGNERIDTGSIASQRLQIDSIKWLASKLAPKIYGDRMQVHTTNNEDTEAMKAELQELRAKLAEKAKSEY